jgi:hypothetical protein
MQIRVLECLSESRPHLAGKTLLLLDGSLQNGQSRHSREGGNPGNLEEIWIPAFAGMTFNWFQRTSSEAANIHRFRLSH